MGVTACQDPPEAPGTNIDRTSDGRKGPDPCVQPTPPWNRLSTAP